MNNISAEIIEKAKAAQSIEELVSLAKESGFELNREEAKSYFEMLNPKSGELSDDELDDVSGGGCKSKSGKIVVTNHCKCFTGLHEIESYNGVCRRADNRLLRDTWAMFVKDNCCGNCYHLEFENGKGVCGVSK